MGPTQLPVAPPPARYAATALGAFGGGALGGLGGLFLARAMTDGVADAASNSLLVLGLVFLLLWLGTTAGAWLTLRRLRDPLALPSTFMVGAGVPAWSVISIPSLFWSLEALPSGRVGEIAATFGLAAILTVPPTVAARWIILKNEKMSEREEN